MIFAPQPGFQTEVLLCPIYDILCGGARYAGKSFLQMLFFLKGNPDQPQGYKDANTSYVYHPYYRALVLRRNYKDMSSWISKAIQMYESSAIGGKWQKTEGMFQFPHPVSGDLRYGAQILVDHLGDEGAFRKYIGHEYHRMGIEELTFIPTRELYLGVSTSCRTTLAELRPQLLNTSNPEGPGLQWVKKHYMFHPTTGDRVKPKTPIEEEVFNPVTGERDVVTRIYIPGTIRDNIIGMKADPHYAARLAALPPTMRKAYLDGDWDVMAGDTYFNEFRVRHIEGEPENYVHCVPSESVPLNPWDQRWAGMDWGFNHPASIYWFAKHEQDERIYAYREFVTRFMGSYEMGVSFARQSIPDISNLDPATMTLWMSPDAFSNRDSSGDAESTSIVARFSAGVRSVLGPQSVYIPDSQELLDAGVEPEKAEDFFAGQALVKEANIVIRRAPNQRVAGWQYMRELLTCQDPDLGAKSFNRKYAKELLSVGDGLARYFAYIEAHRKLATRPGLPRFRIFSDRCPRLIDGIQRATFADDLIDLRKSNSDPQTGQGGDDEVDACRYGLMGFQRIQTQAPPSVLRHRQINELKSRYGESALFWQALDQLDHTAGYNKSASANQFSEGISLHRQASHPSRRYGQYVRDQKLHNDRQKIEFRGFLLGSFEC
jgi:hypothetical protein